jgi:hypothetical protein
MWALLRYNHLRESKRVERARIDCLVFKLATVALPIDANPCKQSCGSGSVRIRTFLVGSGRMGPNPDPRLTRRPYLNFFGVSKIHKYRYFRNLFFLTFSFMKMLFIAYFHQKKFPKKSWLKLYIGQDPNLVKNCPDPQHCLQA